MSNQISKTDKKKKVFRFINILIFGVSLFYILLLFYKERRPMRYHHNFNDTREIIGIEPIQEEWVMNNSNKAVFQKWTPKDKVTPGFYSKYVSCDSRFHKIVAENDNYFIINDSLPQILSVYYLFEQNKIDKFIFELRETDTDESFDLFGYSGERIKVITKIEANEIMKKNGIEKTWP